jgi:voltage-gated sodium channel
MSTLPRHNRIASYCERIIENSAFKNAIVGMILLVAVVIGLETNQAVVAEYGQALRLLDQSILAVFALEILLKLGARLPRVWNFFLDPWNVFDFVVVAICLLPLDAEFASVLRLARTLRVLRLVSALPKLQLLVGALLKSIPSMGYVGLLLSILFYIYGVTAVFFFAKADPLHFGTLGDAILTLFGVITLEGWTALMYDILRGDSGVSAIKVIGFFVSFVLFGTMIMLNLFIGVIMNSMQEMQRDSAADQLKSASVAAELDSMEKELDSVIVRLRSMRQKVESTEL